MKHSSVLILLLIILLTSACNPAATPIPTQAPLPTVTQPALPSATSPVILPTAQPEGQAVNLDLLRNFTYVLDSAGGLQVTLVNGSFKVDNPSQGMVASGELVRTALGDLNGDGVQDAAVTLATNMGGSGTFHELIVVLSQDGKAVQSADLFLDDRMMENQLSIADEQITLDAVRHGPNDPMCCPSVHAITVYRYQAGKIEVVSDKVVTSASNLPDTQYPNSITLDSPQDGAVAGSSLLLRGKTSQMPFEKNLVVRVYDSGGSLVVEVPMMVQGEYGGPGSFDTHLQLPTDLKGALRLDVVDLDAATGQPRGLASVALTIQ